MEFRLKINMDNAAFENCPELALQDMLEKVGQRIEGGITKGNIADLNGNTVGSFEIIL